MSDPQQNERNVGRSSEANTYLVILLALTIGVPLGARLLRQHKGDQLTELASNGRTTTAQVTASSLMVRYNSVRYRYQFIANGQVYGDSVRLTLKPGFYGEQTTLPVLYSPADPENHIVADSINPQEIDSMLMPYTLVALLGILAAVLVLWMEMEVYGQMKLARRGRMIKAAVTNFQLCRKDTQFCIEYSFTTPDGVVAGGSFRLARRAAAGILPHGPIPLLYHPEKPSSNLPLATMWAVKWPAPTAPRAAVATA